MEQSKKVDYAVAVVGLALVALLALGGWVLAEGIAKAEADAYRLGVSRGSATAYDEGYARGYAHTHELVHNKELGRCIQTEWKERNSR